ncbi:MAG: ChrR family anti-sigma-E factor [Kiloniellaceae bacterium]
MTSSPLPQHHLPEEVLLDHAAGSLSEGMALLVATHLALCPGCRAAATEFDALGGALLAAITPQALAPEAFEQVLARIDADELLPAAEAAATAAHGLPLPLNDYVGSAVESLPWRRLLRGIETAELKPRGARSSEGFPVSLMRLAPSTAVPRHTHQGLEITMVLQGGYSDAGLHYERGDVQISDASVDHRPVVADESSCLCLVYQDAPLRLTGPIGRWFNGFLRF